MPYCANCGTECAACAEQTAEQTAIDREIELTRINRKADVEIARIQAGADKEIAETFAEADEHIAEIEAETGVEAAEAVAEVLEEIVAPPEPEEPEPIVITDEPVAEPEDSIEPADSGPPPSKSQGLWW